MLFDILFVTIQQGNRGETPGVYYKSNFHRRLVRCSIKKTVMEVGRQRIGVCSLFYGQPVIQHGSEFCAFIICEDCQFCNLSSLEEYIFLALSAITISFQGDGYG